MATGGNKTSEKAAFIEWWFSVEREPKTMTEWAEANKVNRVTMWEWKKSPEFVALRDTFRTLFRTDFVDATRAMIARAKRGDVSAYQAVARVLGENAPDKVDVSVDRVAYVQPGALRELSRSLHPELN